MGKSQDLYVRGKKIIPGGTQLLSKRPEMFLPDQWPAYYSKAKGCKVWDLDEKEYYDMTYMGIGANILGYADDDVDKAAKNAIDSGSMCTLNVPEEVELAEKLIELHPWAGMVRYAKTGGESVAIAVRIARAYTNRDLVLFCGYHGWSDWYLAANLNEDSALDGHLIKGLEPRGVPRGLIGTSIPFNYNDIDGLKSLIKKYSGKIAAVVMEPIRDHYPAEGFLEIVRDEVHRQGGVLVFDEVSAGFRLCCGGAHKYFGIEPDIITIGKALSNGYPMAAVVGRSDVMQVAQDTFISSTYWTDKVGLAASLATIKKYQDNDVEKHLDKMGARVKKGWQEAADTAGLEVHISGINPLGHLEFCYENGLAVKTLYTQEMLKRGFLANTAFYASYAHTEEIVDKYIEETKEVFAIIKKAIDENGVEDYLEGPVCHSGFQRLT